VTVKTGLADFFTVATMADGLNRPAHNIEYVIKSLNIRSVGWVGHTRLFDRQAFDRVEAELKRIESARSAAAVELVGSAGAL
jgi:hypothetical protein